MNCTELEELAGALALDAASPEEVEQARHHLATCQSGHPIVGQLVATAGQLGQSAGEAEPPPALRERILAAARATPTEVVSAAVARSPVAEPAPAALPGAGVVAGAAASGPVPRLRWSSLRQPWAAAGVAAMLAVAVGLGAWNVQLRQELDRQREEIALQGGAMAAIAADGGFVPFRAAAGAGAAYGGVVLPPGGQPVLVLANLGRPAAGGVYQLWPVHDGEHADIGVVFVPGEDGRYVATLPQMPGAEGMVITAEPHHVAQPTSAPLLLAEVPSGQG